MMEPQKILEVKSLCKYFKTNNVVNKAVDMVDFSIAKGEVLGLVGETGSGKTTIGRLILHLLKASSGKIFYNGNDISHIRGAALKNLRRQMQIIFQDPYSSLDPRMKIFSTLTMPMKALGMFKGKETDRAEYLLDLVGISSSALNRYPHEFSGGQRQRIGIARALAVDPEFIVADEAVSALDVSIQAQVLNLLKDLQEKFHLTSLFITHDLSVVHYMCDRVVVLYMGRIMEIASCKTIFENRLHPYSDSLINAIPIPDPEKEAQKELNIPDNYFEESYEIPEKGCLFHPRCPKRFEKCKTQTPQLINAGNDHGVACFLYEKG